MFTLLRTAPARRAENESGNLAMEETYGLQDYSDGSPVYSRDPVCDTAVDEAKAPAKTEYAGEVFYFCSEACQKTFEEDPGRYIGQRT
jgi:YHS domain-containing protein